SSDLHGILIREFVVDLDRVAVALILFFAIAPIVIYQTRLSRNRIRIQKIKAGVRENSGRNHIVGKWNAVAVENLTGTKRAILEGWILTIRRDTRRTNRAGRIAVSWW